jgi:hypothetical protein
VADREGFEPPVQLPVRRISSAVLSTTQPPVRPRKFRHSQRERGGTFSEHNADLGPIFAQMHQGPPLSARFYLPLSTFGKSELGSVPLLRQL